MCQIAQSRQGECLSTNYKNAHEKLKWKCFLGHIWEAAPANITQGKWCPYCKSGHNEETSRFILEQLTGLPFLKTRSIIGGELDGFCQQINVAFEYQGVHHYKNVPFFKNNVKDIQLKDNTKREKCRKQNIFLIEIPYFIAEMGVQQLEKHIRDCLSSGNIKHSRSKINYVNNHLSLVNRINQIRKNDQIYCARVEKISNGRIYVKMVCPQEHEWITQAYSVLHRNHGCPICAGQNRTIDDVNLIAKQHGGECVSVKYHGAIKKLKWKCSVGHYWMASLNKILFGRWCPECAKKSRTEKIRLKKGYTYELIQQLHRQGQSIQNICSKFSICSATVKKAIESEMQCN